MATSRGAGAAQRGYEYKVYKSGGKVKKYAEGGSVEEDRETRRPMPTSEMLPTSKQRRMAMRRKSKPKSDTEKMSELVRDMTHEERRAEANQMGFSSGGKVAKYAKGGSCRGMGSATKGGKYTIK
jgi:hypothetical protein